ncbi:MAG: MerR family transcriptional regulator [Planctomycetota bacterium]|jgi:MerR family transcriptional regulator/heat shock protein HspR
MAIDTPESIRDDPVISIGTVAEKVGISVSAVRKYESEGLIIPHRTGSGRRLFSHEDVERVKYIQYLIQDLGMNIEGIRRMQALLPCWKVVKCTKKTRNQCKAYMDRSRPCWMIRGMPCAPQGNECRKCAVYRFGSLCAEEIKRLLHDQSSLKDLGEAVEVLMQRMQR